MNEAQFEIVLKLKTIDRYYHFLDKIADWEELWVLGEGNDMYTLITPENLEYLPVWPHPRYSEAWNEIIEMDLKPFRLELEKFLKIWLPGLSKDGLKVGVFPNLEGTVWIIDPKDLAEDLEEELLKYE